MNLLHTSSPAACIGFDQSLWPRVKYLTWTNENLLRQVIYQGLREDKDPSEVRRPVPNQPPSTAPEQFPTRDGISTIRASHLKLQSLYPRLLKGIPQPRAGICHRIAGSVDQPYPEQKAVVHTFVSRQRRVDARLA